MTIRTFHFLHASDFHLERPPYGLDDGPEALRDALADSAAKAAERVFDAAVEEAVDFVILAGDIANVAHCGPRELAVLVRGFEKLSERGIAVYWAGGRAEAAVAWPDVLRLPARVHRFALGEVESIVHYKDGLPLAEILGASYAERMPLQEKAFAPRRDDCPAIAVAYAKVDSPDPLVAYPHAYWALGGEHRHRTLLAAPTVIHYPGSPQVRSPGHWGAHGCTLAEIDETGHARTKLIVTDQVRFIKERVAIADCPSLDQLEQRLRERAAGLCSAGLGAGGLGAATAGPDLLVTWSLHGDGPLAAKLASRSACEELLMRLRAERPQRRPMAWPIAVEFEGAALDAPRAWESLAQNAESPLGQFIREVNALGVNQSLDLSDHAPRGRLDESELDLVSRLDAKETATTLDDAARLGVDLLRFDAGTTDWRRAEEF